MLTIGWLTDWREGGDGGAQCGQSVIYLPCYKLINNRVISIDYRLLPNYVIRLQASGLRMTCVRQLNGSVNCKAHCDFQLMADN